MKYYALLVCSRFIEWLLYAQALLRHPEIQKLVTTCIVTQHCPVELSSVMEMF